jgi:uncharacterized lipoprotein YajG
MEKKSKFILMFLFVAAVVFAAGCAGKTNTAENENQAASGQVAPSSTVTPEETPTSAVTPEEASTQTVIPTVTNESVTENITGNTSAQNETHISNVLRKQEISMNHTLSSGTQSVKQ